MPGEALQSDKSEINVLVVDDESAMQRYLCTSLELDNYRVETAASGPEAVERVQTTPPPDVVLLDVLMPEMNGLDTLRRLKEVTPQTKVIMLSCLSDPRTIVQAIRLGADDYVTKPFKKAELDQAVRKCLYSADTGAAQEEPAVTFIDELTEDTAFVAASPAMRKVRAQVGQLAGVDVPVLLLGESGTGKEVVARLLHKLSARAHRTFLKVNCAALPADLLESELFGYESGAFTGAAHPKPGKFELANKGTILLDEIGEMPPLLQAKLLHVLQDHEYCRLGGRNTVRVDVRILAATNVDVQKALAGGKLREDLYYRLNAFMIELAPLRERREEIPLLLRHFMAQMSERFARSPLPVSSGLLEAAVNYSWPGNLRELENFVKRYLILGDENLAVSELAEKEQQSSSSLVGPTAEPARLENLKSLVRSRKDETEALAIRQALDHTGWNRKEASNLLQISYKALLYKIRQYGLDRSRNS